MTGGGHLACSGLRASVQGRTVFAGLGLELGPGVHALRGENGIGKSTLLRMLAGAQPIEAGRVLIDGIDLVRAPGEARRRLAYVPDGSPVYPFMTGEDLLRFVAAARRVEVGADIRAMLGGFGLDRHLRTRFDALSLGTRRKMLLCAGWIGAPPVLLLDEPSNGLDRAARDDLARLLREAGRDRMVLYASHDEAFIAASGAATIGMLSLFGAG
ncbi:ABC transporter ATP-binding protein [Gluconacetobacter takamatsuzukensis]|uniref:ABC transporter ATP-binding protein n=1 Tax=Gluconacetobacter takamatsuzukensis TaxID=1286190 RepID=A0A7W4KG40_9PROT|nr:ABC transporter ATP-binding protein [Gluconacetobacter takamatsuzukensis]MBB2206279.1 ABC transporter ATP-binding protein [Gluconacetobacter takamatsuzukensis]